MRHHLAIAYVCFINSMQLELEYRTSFLINLLNSLASIGASLLILYALFEQAGSLAGWTFPELLVLLGIFTIADAIVDILLRPSLGKVSEYVRDGGMDYMLLKPVNLQFLLSVRSWSLWGAPNLLLGLGIVLYGMNAATAMTLGNLLLFFAMTTAGLLVLYSLWAILAVTAFWSVQAGQAQFILYSMLDAGRYPVGVYPGWLRLIFTVVVPVAFVTTVPATAAIGRLDWSFALAAVAAAPLTLGTSVLVWRQAIRNYTSASS
jgi:ABC-2 type transport system permease protein